MPLQSRVICRNFPIARANRFLIRAKIIDFQEIKDAVRVLDEIAYELVKRAPFSLVDVCGSKYFVECIDDVQNFLIGVWHAGDRVAIFFVKDVD